MCAVLVTVVTVLVVAVELLERTDGGRTGEISTSRDGSEAAEFTNVEFMLTTARRLCCRCC